MTRYVITQAEFDTAGELQRGVVDQVVGGHYTAPEFAGKPQVLGRLAIVDLIGRGDHLYAHRGGLPLDEVRVREGAHGVEYLYSVRDDEPSDALRELPRLPPQR